jgi:glycosyltransferase involved in cell wall biosynthesis
MKPIVSVLIPIYNSADTLGLALASLKAQSFTDWECVIVDDGSTDHPERVLAQWQDPRIRYEKFPENRGRGAARQAALMAAKGEYVAFVDGDDWIYPHKLERQLAAFKEFPNAVVVSAAMAIVSRENTLVAVRGPKKDVVGTSTRPSQMNVPFPPCMVRTDIAQSVGFDPAFPTVEDSDFLAAVFLGREFVVLSEPLYTYTEHRSVTYEKVGIGFDYCNQMQRKYADRFPEWTRREIRRNNAKKFIYWLANKLGAWEYMISRRSSPATEDQKHGFEAAWKVVSAAAELKASIVG